MSSALAMALRATDEYVEARAQGAPDADALALAIEAARLRFNAMRVL